MIGLDLRKNPWFVDQCWKTWENIEKHLMAGLLWTPADMLPARILQRILLVEFLGRGKMKKQTPTPGHCFIEYWSSITFATICCSKVMRSYIEVTTIYAENEHLKSSVSMCVCPKNETPTSRMTWSVWPQGPAHSISGKTKSKMLPQVLPESKGDGSQFAEMLTTLAVFEVENHLINNNLLMYESQVNHGKSLKWIAMA